MKTVRLSATTIDQIFDAAMRCANHQAEILDALYQSVFGKDLWARIGKLEGWPTCNPETWEYICRKSQEWDKAHFPDVLPGGAWMNNGFSTLDSEGLRNWEVRLCAYQIADAHSLQEYAA